MRRVGNGFGVLVPGDGKFVCERELETPAICVPAYYIIYLWL